MSKNLTKLSLHEFYSKHGKPVDSLPNKSGRGCGDQGVLRLADLDIYARPSNVQRGGSNGQYGSSSYCGGARTASDAIATDTDYFSHYGDRAFAGRAAAYGRGPEGPCPPYYPGASDAAQRGHQLHYGRMAAPAAPTPDSSDSPSCGPCTPGTAYVPAGSLAAGGVGGWVPPPPPPPPSRAAPEQLPAAPGAAPLASRGGCCDANLGYDAGPGYEIRRPQPSAAMPVPPRHFADGSAATLLPPPPPPAAMAAAGQQHPSTALGSFDRAGRGQPAAVECVQGRNGPARAPGPAKPASPRCARDAPAMPRGGRAQPGSADPTAMTSSGAQGQEAKPSGSTPFAAAPQPPALAPVGPRNEFAERLAQKAMASATRSSLLSGSISTSSSASSFDAAAAVVVAAEAVGAAPGDGCGQPSDRPRLALKPRSAPLPDAAPARPATSSSSSSSDTGDAADSRAGSHGSGSVDSATGRPRLNLLPRGSSLGRGGACGTPEDRQQQRNASVFGSAKPREEVLRERGVDPALADADFGSNRLSEAAVARLSGGLGHSTGLSSRSSVHSGAGDASEWHTVAGRKARAASDRRSNMLGGEDPFFGSGAGSFKAGGADVFAGRSYDESEGGFGRRGHGWGGRAACEDEVDVFGRALPTRQAFAGL